MSLTLADLAVGDVAVIESFEVEQLPMKLIEMGCLPGNKVGLLQLAPQRDPLYLNVSAHTIMHPEFCSIFTDFVEKHQLAPNQFGLEVTETAELADINVASESLRILKDKGIKIALDDFGAGYASLKYVRDLPIDVVKLDKHFTFNVSDPATARLISFVSEVCSDLQLEMIGEGIETEEDKKMMLDLGCQIGQGYLMHRPDFLDSFNKKET